MHHERQVAPPDQCRGSSGACPSRDRPKKGSRNFLGGKTDNLDMDDVLTSDQTGRLRKAAEKMPYPYFLLRLEDIEAWLKAGFSVRSVWRIYSEESVPFPGSYRSFLRYCRQHCESAPAARRKAPKARETTPGGPVGVLGQGKRYPPPRNRPPGLTPEQIKRLMDPDLELDPNR